MVSGILRWMYQHKRPNKLARFLNKGWEIIASSGIAQQYLMTLEVVGRKSGKLISFPVISARHEEEYFLVSMLGNDAQWVQNVRAAHGRARIRSGRTTEVLLEEVPVDKRAPILKTYLHRAPGGRPHIPVDKDAPMSEFEAVAGEFPVFRIVRASDVKV